MWLSMKIVTVMSLFFMNKILLINTLASFLMSNMLLLT